MASKVPEGADGGDEPEAEGRKLQRCSERPQQPPPPAARQTLQPPGETLVSMTLVSSMLVSSMLVSAMLVSSMLVSVMFLWSFLVYL